MPRIDLKMPPDFRFQTLIPVRISDVNYGGHVGNDAILGMMHECRLQYFKSMGYSEMDLGGVGTIMADSAILYKGEAFYGDVILAEIEPYDLSRVGFDLYYRLSTQSGNRAVAWAKTGIICFDYSRRKVSGLPEEVRIKMS
jgi:acyl-CoA thioester hydrolase